MNLSFWILPEHNDFLSWFFTEKYEKNQIRWNLEISQSIERNLLNEYMVNWNRRFNINNNRQKGF